MCCVWCVLVQTQRAWIIEELCVVKECRDQEEGFGSYFTNQIFKGSRECENRIKKTVKDHCAVFIWVGL